MFSMINAWLAPPPTKDELLSKVIHSNGYAIFLVRNDDGYLKSNSPLLCFDQVPVANLIKPLRS